MAANFAAIFYVRQTTTCIDQALTTAVPWVTAKPFCTAAVLCAGFFFLRLFSQISALVTGKLVAIKQASRYNILLKVPNTSPVWIGFTSDAILAPVVLSVKRSSFNYRNAENFLLLMK